MSEPAARLLTAEDLLRGGSTHERGELWDGVFVVREPCGARSSITALYLGSLLVQHVAARRLGWVLGADAGFLVARRPDRVLSPAVAYVSKGRLPRLPERHFVAAVPDLVVEVRSPPDSWAAVIEKGGIWIAHRVPLVWCVDPLERRIVELRPREAPVEVGPGGRFSARPALDLEIAVNDLFAPFEAP